MKIVLAGTLTAVMASASYGLAAETKTFKTDIINAKQQEVGTATFTETPSGILVKVELKQNAPGISPGIHAIHIHQVGKCEPPFKSAGEHFNPQEKEHGFLSKQGKHLGDLPNIHVPRNEPVTVEFLVPQLRLSGDKTALFDADGSAIVIHQGADDYQTNPAGNAGDRIACGVIDQTRQAK